MGRDEDDPRDSFAKRVPGVRPLADRARVRPPPEPDPRPPQRQAAEPAFLLERRGDALEARAPDVSRAILADLRAGRLPPDQEIDLHGLDQDAAHRALAEALDAAEREGTRCLLVIHGRGQRSQSEPVLKVAVPEWLLSSPHASRIQAFATAPRQLGGAGASLVLLRRRRRR